MSTENIRQPASVNEAEDTAGFAATHGSVILTVTEIRQLAEFAGLIVAPPEGKFDEDENEEEITVTGCPKGGVFDEESGTWQHYKRIAYFTAYPEEGVYPLGPEVSPNDEVSEPGDRHAANATGAQPPGSRH